MKLKIPARLLLMFVALVMFAPITSAQDARSALTNLPESQVVLYLNARRIINEVAPLVVPPEMLNKALADAKQFVDLNGLEYVVASARFKGEPSAKQVPEFLLLVRGNFGAEGLLSAARMMGPGMYTQETHGAKTVSIFRMKKSGNADAANPDANKPAAPYSVDEIAAVALDANTIAVGIPAFLKDAIDAGTDGGKPRLKPELADLALRDANTLMSIVVETPASASGYLRAFGAPPNPEMEKMLDAVRQVQLAVSMTPGNFGVQSIVRMDASEQANALKGLIDLGLNFAKGALEKEVQKGQGKDPKAITALNALKSLNNTVTGNEVGLSLNLPQAEVITFVKTALAPKPKPASPAAVVSPEAPATKKATPATRRRGRARKG
ncbi:MAG: hypothetical protein ACR2G4_02100 [Pyrinomonadaceae bacterium]